MVFSYGIPSDSEQEIFIALADYYLSVGDIEKAKKIFLEAGKNKDAYIGLSYIFFQEGDIDKAAKYYKKVANGSDNFDVFKLFLEKIRE